MDKIAQRRSLLNKLREKINDPGEQVVSRFSPEFSMLMDTLRKVDDDVREVSVDLKDMLKVARSNFNRREYMTAIAYLGRFHQRVELIKNDFSKLNLEVNSIHNEFLFGDLDPEHKKYLFDFMPDKHKPKPKPKPAPAKADDGKLEKEADLKDKWRDLTGDDNLASERNKALKIWEKRFPKASKEIKLQTERMINRSEVFLNFLLATLKQLASFRATRKVEDYLRLANNYSTKFNAYDDSFNEYFNGSVKQFIDAQRQYEASKAKPTTEPVGSINQELKDEPTILSGDGVAVPSSPVSVGPESLDPTAEIEKKITELEGEKPSNTPRPFPKAEVEESEYPIPISVEEPTSEQRQIVIDPGAQPFHHTVPSGPVQAPQSSVEPAAFSFPIELVNPKIPKAPIAPIFPPSPLGIEPMPEPPPPPATVAPQSIQPFGVPHTVVTPVPPVSRGPAIPMPQVPVRPNPMKVTPGGGPLKFKEVPTTMLPKPQVKADEFIENITKLSGKNPLVLAAEIIKFAKSIEKENIEISQRLISIAKGLMK